MMCKNCDAAYAEYEKVRDPALAEYEKVRDPAWAEYVKVGDKCMDNKKCSECGKVKK